MAFLSTSQARPHAGPGEVQGLLTALVNGTPGQQNRAAQRLFHLQSARGNAAIRRMAGSPQTQRRIRGVWALSIVRPPRCATLLLERSKDPVVAVRLHAVRAIGWMRVSRGLAALKPRLRDSSGLIRREAIRAIARYKLRGIPLLERAARRGRLAVRMLAVAGIGSVYGEKSTVALHRLARRRSSGQVALLAAVELQKRMDPRGAQALARILRHPRHRGLRLQAIDKLGQEITDRGVAVARRVLRQVRQGDGDRAIRQAAAWALRALPKLSPPK